jgi:hypothetical protein
MKQIKILKLLGLIIVFSILTLSCEKAEPIEKSVQTPADEIFDYKDYCGDPLTFALSNYNEQQDYGLITIGNDESNLIFNYDIDGGSDWFITKIYIFVINDGITPPLTIADEWNPDGTAALYPDNFPFITLNLVTQVHQEIITFAELQNEGIDLNECLDIVAGGLLYNTTTGFWKTVYAKTSLKSFGWYVDYCIENCVTFSGCETGYAFGGDEDDCFLNLNTQGNNWGWSNGGIAEGTYNWPIYAGAGQCNISNGTHVGNLNVVYANGTATITYNLFSGISLEETHLHVGDTEETRLPVNKKGKFITAPGQFQYSGGSQFVVSGLSGEIWVTAHAAVCGED